MRLTALIVVVSSLATVTHGASAQDCDTYILIDLGIAPGYTSSTGVDVNGSGQVLVGSWADGNLNMASLWTDLDGDGVVDPGEQPTFGSPGGGSSSPTEVNEGGIAVGFGTISGGIEDVAFRWTAAGGLQQLESLPGLWAQAHGINTLGVIVGKSRTVPLDQGGSRWHAVKWTNGAIEDISPVSSSIHTEAVAINTNGFILGASTSSPTTRWVLVDDDLYFFDGPNPKVTIGLNELGHVVGYVRESNSFWRAARWLWSGAGYTYAPMDGLPGYVNSFARDLNDAGVIVGSVSDPEARAVMWRSGVPIDLNDLLPKGSPWVLREAMAIGPDGTIVGYGDLNGEAFHAYALRPVPLLDSDGDGLPDHWETENLGIDIDCDGTIDLDLHALGARPDHKDLFVEIDLADGQYFHEASRAMVVAAFDNAPVDNPDGTTGITLHLQVDEPGVAVSDVMITNPATSWPDEFDAVKADHFGTSAERAHENAAQILAAKRRAFRYCLFAKQDDYPGSLGVAEIVGNDLVLTLGALAGGPTDVDAAAVFMHELGHTLGLRHGGHDNLNGKPNYISIMNYALARPQKYSADTWSLDYSRTTLPTLNELSLQEPAGIPSPPGLYPPDLVMPYGVDVDDGMGGTAREIRYVWLSGQPCDWNLDGDFDRPDAVQDVNYLGDEAPIAGVGSPSFPQTLEGHDDWANLHYAIGTSGDFADFIHATTLPVEERITSALNEWIDEAFPPPPTRPCAADLDGDTTVGPADLAQLLGAWGSCVACPADLDASGDVGPADLAVLLGAWGPCPG